MTTPPATMLVSVGKQSACVKIAGRANFSSSIDFKRLLSELLNRGYVLFLLDLSDCILMDSTFLGVLAGFGLKMRQPDGSSRIELVNANPRVSELLENLGVLQLFKISHGPITAADNGPMREVPNAEASREEVTRASLEAHQTLMAIHPENVARFKDVAQFLAEDLQRIKG